MGTPAGSQQAVVLTGDWQAEVLRLLEESHLAAWTPLASHRVRFGAGLAQFVQGMSEVETCSLQGRAIASLDDLCSQLERSIPGPALDRRISGRRGLVSF